MHGIELVGHHADADLVALATRSLSDPETTKLQEELLESAKPHLYFGIESSDRGFIGPLHRPDELGPCLACLRTRLNANSPYSTIRQEYVEQLHRYQKRALQHAFDASLSTSLAAWLVRRVSNLDYPLDERAAPDLVLIDQASLIPSHHVLLPVPTCRLCRYHQNTENARKSAGLEGALDEQVGIVHSVSVRKSSVGPSIHLSGTTSADSRLIRKTMRAVNNGGAGYSRQSATTAALGESIERYAAGVYHSNQLRLSTWADLDDDAIHPSIFARFSESQYTSAGFPFERFDTDTPIRWKTAIRWSDGATVWVPASQVYLPYRRTVGEAMIGQSISSGLAAGTSLANAVLSGLQEVIERDALAVSWMHKLPPRALRTDLVEDSLTLKGYLTTRTNWNVRFHDLSLDLSPSTVVAVMDFSSGRDAVMSFGSACRREPHQAAEKAFLEAAQGLTYIRRLLPSYNDWEPGVHFEHVDDFNHHAILYTKFPELRSQAGYLIDPTNQPQPLRPVQPAGDTKSLNDQAEVDLLVQELRESGYETYVVDLTPPDIALLGVAAVRVLVPGLVHLSGTHTTRLLGSDRLWSLPRQLGFESSPDNPYPHPLP